MGVEVDLGEVGVPKFVVAFHWLRHLGQLRQMRAEELPMPQVALQDRVSGVEYLEVAFSKGSGVLVRAVKPGFEIGLQHFGDVKKIEIDVAGEVGVDMLQVLEGGEMAGEEEVDPDVMVASDYLCDLVLCLEAELVDEAFQLGVILLGFRQFEDKVFPNSCVLDLPCVAPHD